MVDKLLDSSWDVYRKMCIRLKIPNWKKRVYTENSIMILKKLEKRIEDLEKEVSKLKEK